MKKDIHPEYHMIDVKMTDGTILKMKSTYGAEGDTLTLAVFPSSKRNTKVLASKLDLFFEYACAACTGRHATPFTFCGRA